MNPYACRVVLRPRGPLEVFDMAFRFAQAKWRPLLRLAVPILVPLWFVCLVAVLLTDGHPILLVIPLLAAPWIQAPFTLLTARLLFADDVTPTEALSELLRRVPKLILSTVIASAALVAGVMSCGLLWFPARAAVMLAPEACLLEPVDWITSIRRTFNLTSAEIGSMLVAVGATWGLTFWFVIVFELGGMGFFGSALGLPLPFGGVAEYKVSPWVLGAMLAVNPMLAVYRMMLYLDVRTRVEGWDLQVALRMAEADA